MNNEIQRMLDDGVPRDQIEAYVKQTAEYALDFNNLPSQPHNWVRRGIKMSCEGANHPHHSHFLFVHKR